MKNTPLYVKINMPLDSGGIAYRYCYYAENVVIDARFFA
jgi:hypothetical protein